jgi:hypothetical protein
MRSPLFGRLGPAVWTAAFVLCVLDCFWQPSLRSVFIPFASILFIVLVICAIEWWQKWRRQHEAFLTELEEDCR